MKKKNFAPVVFLAPFMIASSVFTLIPVIYSFYISFHDFSFLNPSKSTFSGFENYIKIFEDEIFLKSLGNTLKYLLAVVPLLICISLLLAVALNEKIRFKSFFRSAFYLPYVVAPVAMGVIAVQLFSKDSFVVRGLSVLGLKEISWHTASPYAFWLIVIVIVWSQIGFYMVLYLTGLQNIPTELYEAAEIDGAKNLKKFWFITIPQLKNTTVLVLFMSVLSTLQIFDQPYIISTTGLSTPGSPGDTTLSMVMYIYNQAFRHREMGPASAAAFIVFAIIIIISILQKIMTKKMGGDI